MYHHLSSSISMFDFVFVFNFMILVPKSPSVPSYTAQTLSSESVEGTIEAVTDSNTVEDYTLGEQCVFSSF